MNLQRPSQCAGIAAAIVFTCASFSTGAAVAADPMTAPATRDLAAIQKARSAVQTHATQAKSLAQANKVAFTGPQAAETFANPQRAYPPSCLGSPMALGAYANDPNRLVATIGLIGDPYSADATEKNYTESDTVTVFRVPCSGGFSATLIEIDRPQSLNGATPYPTFPGVQLTQGSVTTDYLRLADDPNTFFATNYPVTPLVFSDVFVLEYYYGVDPTYDYNNALNLFVDNFNTQDTNRLTEFSLPNYNPLQYAATSKPLPISGYMSTNWSSSTQNGEGMVVQVYDNGDQATRTLSFAWFTYDMNGLPFWLFGIGGLHNGDTTVTAQTIYLKNGSFAPASIAAGATSVPWGSVTFSFPDCGHMKISFKGDASTVQGPTTPTSGSSATYLRAADVNGLVCQ